MPLAKEPEIIPKPPEDSITPITPRYGLRSDGAFKYGVVDVRKRSIDTLLANVEGSKWKINYYRQLLVKQMEPTSYQEDQLIPYQQYEAIYNFPLVVTDPLTTTQNEETLLFEVSGSGVLSFAIIPNVGDLLTADIGDGRLGLFSVERIVRKTILKDSVYEIEYSLLDYLDKNNEQILKKRIVRDLYYCEDYLGTGRGPLISSKELIKYKYIEKNIKELFIFYNRSFTDFDNTVLIRPSDEKTYDPYISSFWDKILPKDDFNCQNYPRVLVVENTNDNKLTILDNMLKKDESFLNIYRKVKIIDSKDTFTELIYNGVALTDVEKVIVVDESEPLRELFYETEKPETSEIYTRVMYHPIDYNGTYIFSIPFYLGRRLWMSKIEILTIDYLNKKPLVLDDYIQLLNSIETMGRLEKFYYIPILITIGLDHLRLKN